MDLRLGDPDPHIRDLAYLLFFDELLGPEWVERWARERGKLDTLREAAVSGVLTESASCCSSSWRSSSTCAGGAFS